MGLWDLHLLYYRAGVQIFKWQDLTIKGISTENVYIFGSIPINIF
jgi:hypothetical protein